MLSAVLSVIAHWYTPTLLRYQMAELGAPSYKPVAASRVRCRCDRDGRTVKPER